MSKINDGGPAFPVPDGEAANLGYHGLSIRDWFAGQAPDSPVEFPNVTMAALFVGHPAPSADDVDGLARLSAAIRAKCAYLYADALLVERERQP